MTKDSRFNGEYQKTGTREVTDSDKTRVEKADAKLAELLGGSEDGE